MYARRLTTGVTVPGRSLVGVHGGTIRFEPTTDDEWTWRGRSLRTVPLEKKSRRVCLRDGTRTFDTFEHIGPLFATGLIGVELVTSKHVPRFSRTSELWGALKPHTIEDTSYPLAFVSPARSHTEYCGASEQERYIEIHPNHDGELRITVCIDYPDIGGHVEQYCFPNLPLLERVFGAHTFGRVPLPQPLARLAEPVVRRFTALPLIRDAYWASAFRTAEEKQMLRQFVCDHRAQDILGLLRAALPAGCFLSADIRSWRGGHDCDVKLVKTLRRPGALHYIGS